MIGLTQLAEVNSTYDEGWKDSSRVGLYRGGEVSSPWTSGIGHNDNYILDQNIRRNQHAFYGSIHIPHIPSHMRVR